MGVDADITPGRALRWVTLAFVPSSLMLGVTSHITTDIAAIPLLWILPLALYLLSFILVFSRWLHAAAPVHGAGTAPVLVLLVIFVMVSHIATRMWALILLHLFVLFVVAMVLSRRTGSAAGPARAASTKFYLLMSLGGVLGGLFNAALDARCCSTSTAEYPLGAWSGYGSALSPAA